MNFLDWHIKYNASEAKPWRVYSVYMRTEVLKASYPTREEAEAWIAQKELQWAEPLGPHHQGKNCACDRVSEASLESFPASDAPSWTRVAAA